MQVGGRVQVALFSDSACKKESERWADFAQFRWPDDAREWFDLMKCKRSHKGWRLLDQMGIVVGQYEPKEVEQGA